MGDSAKKQVSLAKAVFSGSLGNMLEWFDYGLYGYFAVIISTEFFTSEDPMVALILSFMTFGVGFLVRPIGGILIGAYADKHGRIKALTLTILGMGICLAYGASAYLPADWYCRAYPADYFASFAGFVHRRRIRLFVDVHFGIRQRQNRAFLVSWQPFSVGVGLIVGSTAGLIITSVLPSEALYAWGWRIPFICGILGLHFTGCICAVTSPIRPSSASVRPRLRQARRRR